MCTYTPKNWPIGASLQKATKPRIAGLCGREVALAFTSLYPVLKSNGHIFGQNEPNCCLNFRSVMPIFRISQTAFFLNFAHKGRTLRLGSWMGNDATLLEKIAHSGPHEEVFSSARFSFYPRLFIGL